MKILLDTCTVSESLNPRGDQNVKESVAGLKDADTFLSVLTIGEITKGISLLPEGRRRREIEHWLVGVEARFQERILPIDTQVARIWGELSAQAQSRRERLPVADGLIAATAVAHGLYVMTRNTKDFVSSGVLLINPWQGNE